MTTTRAPARTFRGSEIRRAIADAIEAWPETREITEFHAGENMQVTATSPDFRGDVLVGFSTYAFNGVDWSVISWD